MITARVSNWLRHRRAHCKAGDISPTYLRELERYARADGYIPWWKGVSIFEVTYGGLEDWSQSLAEQGLSGSTRRKVLGAFRTFLAWLRRRGDIDAVPEFPSVPVDEYAPTIISANAQDAILAQIPFDRRGAILAAVRLGIRPGEIRALDVDDYQEGWIMLSKAKKGPNDNAPTRGTKNRQCRRLPVPEDLQEWITWRLSRVTSQDRLSGPVALFPNPTACNPEKRWIANTLRKEWNRAAKAVGIRVKMYEGTNHAFASNAIAAGVDLYRLRDFLGHKDARSTERYAKLADVGRRRCYDRHGICRSLVARAIYAARTRAMPRGSGGADGTLSRARGNLAEPKNLVPFAHRPRRLRPAHGFGGGGRAGPAIPLVALLRLAQPKYIEQELPISR
jgi:integrase